MILALGLLSVLAACGAPRNDAATNANTATVSGPAFVLFFTDP